MLYVGEIDNHAQIEIATIINQRYVSEKCVLYNNIIGKLT